MWQSMTREELDRAYNNSLAVTNSAGIIQAWGEASQAIRATNPDNNDLPYGSASYPSYDYFSAGANTPVVAFIHGGFWQNRAKSDFSFIVPALLASGMSVAMLGYSLAPYAKIDRIVQDVRSGIRAVLARVTAQQATCPDLWLVGWSAGGHLAAMTLDEPGVIGATAISGIYDLEPMRHCYINDKLALDALSSKQFSPIKLPQTTGKILDLFVGDAELEEMQRQTIGFAAYLAEQGAPGVLKTLPGLNHYTVLDELARTDGLILQTLRSHLLETPST